MSNEHFERMGIEKMDLDKYYQQLLDGCNHHFVANGTSRKCINCKKEIPLCEHEYKPIFSNLLGEIEVCQLCNSIK